MHRGSSFVILLFLMSYSFGQSCSLILNEAEDKYEDGLLLEIETNSFLDCLNTGSFTDAEEIRARKLLTKMAIFTDDQPRAEQELIELLTIDPVHELILGEDPKELAILLDQFRTWPVYRFEFYAGINLSLVTRAQEFSTLTTGYQKKYIPTLGFQGGVRITKHLRNFIQGLELGAGLEGRATSYTVTTSAGGTITHTQSGETFTETYTVPFKSDIVNSQQMIRMPLFVRANMNYSIKGNFIPYGFLGMSLDYLSTAKYSSASRSGGTTFTLSDDNNLKEYRQVNNFGVSLIGGIGAKVGGAKRGNFFFGELRFDKSIFLYNVPDERYSNPRVVGDLQFVEDDLYLDIISAQLGYIWSIFKPEKLSNLER